MARGAERKRGGTEGDKKRGRKDEIGRERKREEDRGKLMKREKRYGDERSWKRLDERRRE